MAEDLEDDIDEGAPQGGGDRSSGGAKGGGGKRRGGKVIVLAGVVLLLVIVAVGAGLYFSGILGSGEQKAADPQASGSTASGGAQDAGAVPVAVFYDLPEMLVNLNSAGRKQSFLKIRVSLELQNALDVSRVEAVMPRVSDSFQVYLRELRVEDLQGSAGMLRLREELLSRVNAVVSPAKVNDVLFKEMLVQ